MIFTYCISIETLCFVIPNLTLKFDQNNELYLLIFYFLDNLGDALGKMTPVRWNIHSSFFIHFWTLFRAVFKVYFIFLLFSSPSAFWSHYFLRGLSIFLFGLSNGFLTKNYFCIASLRFRHPDNQDFAGFFTIFALIFGVACGTLSGVLWDL